VLGLVSVQVTKGLLTPTGTREIFAQISDAFASAHGLPTSHAIPRIVGHLAVTEGSESYVGGKPQSLAIVEVKVPSIMFPTSAVKQKFVSDVTDIIDRYQAGSHERKRTFVIVTHAVEDLWGIGGKAYSNNEVTAALQQARVA
jgi:phenylpyruvate tautomerase PptA (4-oxalocrotonate tautomerase family)